MTTQPSALSSQPSLRGWITTNYTTYKGKRLGPYYVRTWFENGKRRKQYVKKQDLPRVLAACLAHRESKLRSREIAERIGIVAANLNWLERMASRLDKGPIRPEDHAFVEQIKQHGIAIPGRPKLKSASARMLRSQYPIPNTQHPTPSSSQPTGISSQPTLFMDHFFQKFWKDSFKDAERIAESLFALETTQDKWKRWRDSLRKNPKPRQLPTIACPDWVDKNEINAAIEQVVQERGIHSATDSRSSDHNNHVETDRAPGAQTSPETFPTEGGWSAPQAEPPTPTRKAPSPRRKQDNEPLDEPKQTHESNHLRDVQANHQLKPQKAHNLAPKERSFAEDLRQFRGENDAG